MSVRHRENLEKAEKAKEKAVVHPMTPIVVKEVTPETTPEETSEEKESDGRRHT